MTEQRGGAGWSYDPWDAAVIDDPYPFYERLRTEGGCHELRRTDMAQLRNFERLDVVALRGRASAL